MLIFFLILEEIFSQVEHDVYCGLVTYSLYYVMYVPSILSFLRVFIRNGFLGDSDSKESACNEGGPGSPGLGRSPQKGTATPPPALLPRELHEQRSLAGCSPRDCSELDMAERLIHTYPVGMAGEFCQMLFQHLLRLQDLYPLFH